MSLQFHPYPIPEKSQTPNEGLQILDRATQMAQLFQQYNQQKQANELAKQARASDLAKNIGEGGEDFLANYRTILSGKTPLSPAAAPFAANAPQPTAAPAQTPGPQMSMVPAPAADPYSQYQSIQDPMGPLPGLGDTPTPASTAVPGGAPAAQSVETPGLKPPQVATDLTPEHFAEIRRKKGSKGLKEFTDAQSFLTSQKQADAQMSNLNLDNESKLRGDYTKASTNFKTVSENLQTIQSIAQKPPSAAGDISLVFSYMKLMDPNSTVREGEYSTAANAAGVGDRLRSLYNKLITGEKLAPAQRGDFINTSGNLYQGWLDKQKQTDDSFRGIATRSRVNPENVLVPFGVPNFDRAALARSPAATERPGGGQAAAPAATDGDTVRVQSPDGKVGSIPRANLAKAQQRGFKVMQ